VNPARTAGSAEPQPFEVVDGIRQVQVQLERLAADGARVVGVDIQHHLVLSLHRVLRNLATLDYFLSFADAVLDNRRRRPPSDL
jgi:hypothetical protein